MKIRKSNLLLFVIVILAPVWVFAEEYHRGTFAGLGIGQSSLGLSLVGHVTQRYDNIAVSIRYVRAVRELWLESLSDEGDLKLDELGIFLGYPFEKQRLLLTIEAGLALTMGDRCHEGRATIFGPEMEYETLETVIGLAIGSQIYGGITEHVGIGVYPYFNINEHKNYGGVAVEILVGRL